MIILNAICKVVLEDLKREAFVCRLGHGDISISCKRKVDREIFIGDIIGALSDKGINSVFEHKYSAVPVDGDIFLVY